MTWLQIWGVYGKYITAPKIRFGFPICFSVSKLECIKSQLVVEKPGQILLFLTPAVTIRGGVGEPVLQVQPRWLGPDFWYTSGKGPLRGLED